MTAKWLNWSRAERSAPELTIAPRTLEHLVLTVQRALEAGRTVKPIGASHSFTGIGATDGLRLDMSRLRGLVDVDLERGRVTLWAGTHLWELPGILNPLGLALENMGDIDRQTVSGATSTGTHGTGLAFGGLASRVVGATLVTGRGEVLTVGDTVNAVNHHAVNGVNTAKRNDVNVNHDNDHDDNNHHDHDHHDHDNAELLPAVALGLGALGVLATVTIQCVPRYLLRAVEAPLAFDAVLAEYEERQRAADHFEFFWFPHTETVRTKTNERLPFEAPRQPLGTVARFVDEELANNVALGALVGFERWVPRSTPRVNRLIETLSSRRDYTDESHRVFVTRRRVRFHEMEYGLPLAAVPDALRELRAMIERRRFTVSFPIEVRSAAADPLWLSTAHGRETGYVAVHRYFRDPDRGYFREAEALLAAHGGRPHWGKMHTLGAAELRDRYPRFDDFVKVRERLDPERVFANPYLNRVLGE